MPYPEKPAQTESPIHEILKRRWSPRAIDPRRRVEAQKIRSLLEAARWAPSSYNDQPWRILVFTADDGPALEAARSCLAEGNAWAKQAPLLILTVAQENFAHNGKPNRHAQHDVGSATENLMLQATAFGLAAHAMAGFDPDKARNLFHIPEGSTPMAMVAVGYPGKSNDLPEKLKEAERAPRKRKDLAEIAFGGDWAKPFERK